MNVLKTRVKRSAVKILATTEDLFEKLCYLTKLSWKAGEGTEISIDTEDLANCLGVSERTISNHLKKLRELGLLVRLQKNRHTYELHNCVLADICNKKHKFIRCYLDSLKTVDNLLIFPTKVEKNSTSHIYMNQNKSNKSLALARENALRFKKAQEEACGSRCRTVQDMRGVLEEVFAGLDFQLSKRLCAFLVKAMQVKFKTLERFREYCERIKKSWIWYSGRIKSLIHYILKFGVIDAFAVNLVANVEDVSINLE